MQNDVGKDLYDRTIATLVPMFEAKMGHRQAFDAAVVEAERHFMSGFKFPDLESWAFEQQFTNRRDPQR